MTLAGSPRGGQPTGRWSVLRANGASLVDAGGDIAVSGLNSEGDAWPIGIEDPFQPDVNFEMLYLEDGGVATSGKDYRHWRQNGKLQHHIIDPATGLPAETDVLTATVIAPTVMKAEAIAKGIMISGSRDGLSWLDSDENSGRHSCAREWAASLQSKRSKLSLEVILNVRFYVNQS